jgi:hypothetical protein
MTVVCGEFDAAEAVEIKRRLKTRIIIPDQAARLRRAGFLADLGQARLAAGDYDNTATLQPLYLRHPPITERKKH